MKPSRWTIVALLTVSVGVSLVRGSREVRSWADDPASTTNLHVKQAAAFLRGEVALDRPALDTALYEGRSYVPFPPGPAIVFLPIVAIAGERLLIATAVCVALTILNIFTLVAILRRLAVPEASRYWLVLAFFFGSGYWYVLSFSEGVWFSASVVAVSALLWALREMLTANRGWVIGSCLGLAFLSRQFTIAAAPFFLLSSWSGAPPGPESGRRRRLIGALIPIAAAITLTFGFNAARFGSIWETGYGYLPLDGYEQARRDAHGLFSLAYVPVNLFHLLLHGFTLTFDSPDRLSSPQLDWFGAALPFASPFVLLAFFARRRTAALRWLWITVGVMVFAHAMYYVNGAGQLNWQRYALDYWPLLFLLVIGGFLSEVERDRATLWKAAIAYAVGVNALVLAWFDLFSRFLTVWPKLFS